MAATLEFATLSFHRGFAQCTGSESSERRNLYNCTAARTHVQIHTSGSVRYHAAAVSLLEASCIRLLHLCLDLGRKISDMLGRRVLSIDFDFREWVATSDPTW
jgi:hypothetical protein